MNSTELHDQFRTDVVDTEEPQLWSDAEVYDYLDDAQKMFCRLTGGLGDASSALTVLSYVSTTDWVALSPLVLKVRDAYRTTDGLPVEAINYEDLPARGLRLDGRIGRPKYIILGLEANKVRLYPYPDAAGTLQLVVDRLPLVKITDVDQNLEVADQHKTGLGLWMKSRAYSKQDAETFDRNKADGFEQKFRAYCAEAKKEKDRAKHKTRVVSYGGL
jgi:hypothetical protein